MLNAVKVMRPPLEKLYDMLTDEQKARFNAFTQNQRPPENEGGATVSGGSPVAGSSRGRQWHDQADDLGH
jgi:hypothetical protein